MLNGMNVIITGASGGLGASVTRAFLDAGARVAGVARTIRPGELSHPAFTAYEAELTSAERVGDLTSRIAGEMGRIGALVHLVGTWGGGARTGESDPAEADRMMDLNFRTAFFMIRATLPHMMPGPGRILAVSSRSSVEPAAGSAAYNASKAALNSLIQTAAIEYAAERITANAVMPGTMDTPANRKAMPDADFTRWVQPQDVAAMLVHLASPSAASVTGALVPIFGSGR
jgi:NAD(P)-dependent dehydrogenase (short-subunit alcohol dehydrogenase family)